MEPGFIPHSDTTKSRQYGVCTEYTPNLNQTNPKRHAYMEEKKRKLLNLTQVSKVHTRTHTKGEKQRKDGDEIV